MYNKNQAALRYPTILICQIFATTFLTCTISNSELGAISLELNK